LAINKSILGQDGFERKYHKIPSITIFLNEDGTGQVQIITQNWKDEQGRINNNQALNLQHSIIGLPASIMKIGYTLLKKYFPDYADGDDIMEDKWKDPVKNSKVTLVSQTLDGKLIEKHMEDTDGAVTDKN
jgi:hypothetical protein